MTDGKVYSVALDGVVKEFTATDGKVATLEVTPTQIPSGVAKEIKMVAKDANGVVVYEAPYAGTTSDYTFTIETKTGYTQGSKLYLTKTGDTAVAKVTKHSFKYDTTGKEIETIESGEITITAVDPAAVSGFQVRIANDNSKKFDDVKDNTTLPVGGNKIAMFKITDANREEIGTYPNYSVASSDPTVMQIAGNLSGSAAGNGISIYGLKEGTAYILIKDTNTNSVVASLPITVVATPKPATLTLDKTSLTVSNSSTVNETVFVTATIKDQYGNDYDIEGNKVSAECTAKPNNASSALTGAETGKTVAFAGAGKTKGIYVFKVTYTDGTNTTSPAYVTVEVKEPTGNTDYVLAGEKTEIDTKITSTQKTTTNVKFEMYETLGGVKNSKVTSGVTYEVKKDGKTVYKTSGTTHDFISESTGVLTVKALDVTGGIATKIENGTYTVIGTYSNAGKDYTRTATLVVKDTQSGLVVTQKAAKTVTTAVTTGSAVLFDENTFKVTNADGSTIAIKDVKGACAAQSLANGVSLVGTTFDPNDVITVTKVIADVTIEGVTFEMSVDVNYVVTVVSSLQV